jgi:hypothetical protein
MYAFFWPDKQAMDHLSTLIDEGRVSFAVSNQHQPITLDEANY